MIAQVEGTNASKNIGRDSMANALHSSKVDNSKCLSLITGIIFLTYVYSNSVPLIKSISNYRESKEE
jgi:hypothetical protein